MSIIAIDNSRNLLFNKHEVRKRMLSKADAFFGQILRRFRIVISKGRDRMDDNTRSRQKPTISENSANAVIFRAVRNVF